MFRTNKKKLPGRPVSILSLQDSFNAGPCCSDEVLQAMAVGRIEALAPSRQEGCLRLDLMADLKETLRTDWLRMLRCS
jgi:hypothetical protein